jgi:hypothetical protein
MYNKGLISTGLVIFAIILTLPVWFNKLNAGDPPKPEYPPGGEKACVASASEMRDSHMVLLNKWRDEVLRDNDRSVVEVDGKKYRKGLQTTCLQCHTSKEKFCDTCHEYASVRPTCWNCHLTPKAAAEKTKTIAVEKTSEAAAAEKKETH